mmetsp:Transcript_29304/g.44140  ORF Transcript_29304/g.44140 Transcript_29304/m.44140 type:complete len:183 (+) Transcript_29304:556-1104(+)
MVDKNCGGKASPVENPELTTPHSISMVDFDGDCMSDLFMTVQDGSNPSKKYYEIYLRRQVPPTAKANGLNSFCLAQVDDISQISNNQVFDFADIDRDGMIDMLFLTDRKTMNFIVNYNMLKGPSNSDVHRVKQEPTKTLTMLKQSICQPVNRPMAKISNIFPSYSVALNMQSDQPVENDDEQ